MKHKTLLALGVAGALGCGAASAATFLCVTDPSDVSFRACAELAPDALASSPSVGVRMSEPFVTYSSIEYADDLASMEPSADLWLYSEPMVVTHFYTFDSALR